MVPRGYAGWLLTAWLAAAPAHAAPSSRVQQGDMELRVAETGNFSLLYRGMPLIHHGSLYLADKNWSGIFPQSGERAFRVTVGKVDRPPKPPNVGGSGLLKPPNVGGFGGPSADQVRLTTDNALCAVTQEFRVAGDGLRYQVEYEVKPGTAALFAVCDIFLNKDLLAGGSYEAETAAAPARGALDVGQPGWSVAALKAASLRSSIGDIRVTAATEVLPVGSPTASAWTLRSVCDRPWGSEALRTFTLLNQAVVPGAGLRQRLTLSLQVTPAADIDARLAARGMERGLRALAGEEKASAVLVSLPGDPVQRVGALQAELEKACRQWQGARQARAAGDLTIIPQPQEMKPGKGAFPLRDGVRVVVAPGLSAREKTGVSILLEELKEKCGITARPVTARSASESGAILIGEPERHPAVASWLKRWKVTVDAKSPGPEGYVLRVTPETIVIAGSDAAGTFYGVQSLVQLLRRDDKGRASVPEVAVRDWPAMQWRGIHIEGMGRASTEDFRRVIRRVAARTKMNTFIFGGSYKRFRWKSRPEITPPDKGMSMEELGAIAGYARDHFLEFIPQFQSAGHLGDLISVYPEIAEVPAGPGVRCTSYCPSNPKTYEILFDLWQEVIDATRPRYFHAGHDEISHIGVCERCKGKSQGELFAADVTRIRDWLKARGAETLIWGDILLNQREWRARGPYAANGTTTPDNPGGTDTAVDLLPKDVIICDWHYAGATEYPTLEHFKGKCLRVLACPWYNAKNNFHFAEAARNVGALGVIVTDWGFLSTLTAAGTSILGAEYAWTPGTPALDALPYAPERALQELLRPRRPSDAIGARFAPVDLSRQATHRAAAADWGDRESWLGLGPGNDLWMLRGGRQVLEGMTFDLPAASDGTARCVFLSGGKEDGPPSSVEGIAVGTKAESLLLLTGLQVDEPSIWGGAVARLSVRYEDGATETADLSEGYHVTDWRTYAQRVNPWHWREGYADLYGARPALRALTRFGEDVNLQACEWLNPHPEKAIASLDLQVVRKDPRLRLALLGVTAVSLPGNSGGKR